MQDDDKDQPGYLGAMFDEEQRLVLVPVDPSRPWAAFRRMRKMMKRSRKGAQAVNMFKPPPQEAKIIELPRRDAAE
jgi:hypothetical protein